MEIKGKVFVVTGAGNGIGRELALQLLKNNARVAGVDLDEQALFETRKLAGNRKDEFLPVKMDITDREMANQLPDRIIKHFGSVDGLINNAGIIQKFVPVNELPLEDADRVFRVNFNGTLYVTKAFLPVFLKRPEAHIINISSMGGFLPVPGQTLYGASKAAVKLFTEGLYAELKDTNVRVTIVFPGAVATNISANSGLKIPESDVESDFKPMPADKAAAKIISGIEKNSFRILVGSDARMLDKLYRIAPKFATNFITKKMKSLLEN
ncbi:MAG: SDR family NAD(P)-dependent oxidoreductase [Balneolaceae bacterium]|nr:SDR family NAD(P)-dependent oxidoreductase [Balneolaceae bacterium]